ncbi:MAG: SIS domain-containing protein [Alphaproteobacteria bacterium]|nr:SIS domain-containing protein [Alphaproteobacteria bacterium]
MTDATKQLTRYFDLLSDLGRSAQASDGAGKALVLDEAIGRIRALARVTHEAGHTLYFIGNGGSAGIASHLAIDYSKNGNLRSLALNDGAQLTCLANDLGYENVFSHPIGLHGRSGDLLIAISSSGRSVNILKAAETAKGKGMAVVTLSGFDGTNPLRRLGDINLHVASHQYGFVEILHLALLHAVLDFEMGWNGQV